MVKLELRHRGKLLMIPDIDASLCRLQDAKLLIALLTNVSIQSMKLIGLTKAPLKGKLSDITLLQDAGLKYGKGANSDTVTVTVIGAANSETVDKMALEELCCVPAAWLKGQIDQLEHRREENELQLQKTLDELKDTEKYTVVSDLECKFTPTSEAWQKLEKHSNNCEIHYINAPRPGKKLLVLDLDHTILDFSKDVSISAAAMKRPHLDEFLSKVYVHYDLCVWSQTRWTWLEVKLHELGMVTHPEYKICFCLDKTTMFRAPDTGEYVKPLAIIWTKCADFRWNSRNTLHVDDLSRNFDLNPKNGILIKPFYRNDNEVSREKRLKKQMKAHAKQSRIESTKKRRDNGLTPSVEQVFLMPGVAQSGFKDGPVDLIGTSSISPSESRDIKTLELDEDDDELLHLSNYLLSIALVPDVSGFDHSCWRSLALDTLANKVGEKE